MPMMRHATKRSARMRPAVLFALVALVLCLFPVSLVARDVPGMDALGGLTQDEEGASKDFEGSYVPFVKPMDQEWVDPEADPKVAEGCGPVAAAMLLGFWKTEKGYEGIMDAADAFDGTAHPRQTILDLRRRAWTFGNPLDRDGEREAATIPVRLKTALSHWVDEANESRGDDRPELKVVRKTVFRSKKKRLEWVKERLEAGQPVILLLHNIPGSMRSSGETDKSFLAWHYVVAVGYDAKADRILVVSGWAELDKSSSSGPEVHTSRSDEKTDRGHLLMTPDEFESANPSLIWIEPKE